MRNMKSPSSILIADSGSTKTDWLLISPAGRHTVRTGGINPFMLSAQEIKWLLERDLLPRLPLRPRHICFYGAGCRDAGTDVVRGALADVLGLEEACCEAYSDVLGAARALCGNEPGVACIMGTGSNSCLYDGGGIVQNVSPLGYVLGDEGSGAVLGRRLVSDVLKGQLSEGVCRKFRERYPDLQAADIIRRVYREPFPNRFLAGFAPFLEGNKEHPEIKAIIEDEFERFFRRNVAQYRRPDLPVNFVGSVAFFLRVELQSVASALGYRIGRILRTPIEGLAAYHASV